MITIMFTTMIMRLLSGIKGYQKRKAQKAKIKEELLPIAWHPDRVIKKTSGSNR